MLSWAVKKYQNNTRNFCGTQYIFLTIFTQELVYSIGHPLYASPGVLYQDKSSYVNFQLASASNFIHELSTNVLYR